MSSRSTTKLPGLTNRTRERNEIPRDGENCIRTLILPPPYASVRKNIQSGPEPGAGGRERGEFTRTHTLTRTLGKIFEIHIGIFTEVAESTRCVVTPTRFIIFQTCLFLPIPQGVTLSHPGEMRRGKAKCNNVAIEWKDSLTRRNIYILFRADARTLRDN